MKKTAKPYDVPLYFAAMKERDLDETFPVAADRKRQREPKEIPLPVARLIYASMVAQRGGRWTLRQVQRAGGFTLQELDRFAPGWKELAADYEVLLNIATSALTEIERIQLAVRQEIEEHAAP